VNIDQVQAMLEPSKRKCFGKHVDEIIRSMDFLHYKFSLCNIVPNKVILDTNMFGLEMIGIILYKLNMTITIKKYYIVPCVMPSSIPRLHNEVTSFTPSVAATYSTSIVDRAAMDCRDAF